MKLGIGILGVLEIVDGERVLGPRDLGGVRPKQLLEILVAARGRRVPVDRIAELIWEERRPDDITASIQTFVSVLRRRLVTDRARARQLVVTEDEAYRFATDAVELDLDRFDELVERSAREPRRTARRSLEQALSLVRGDVFEDEPYALWAQDLRGLYQGRVLDAHLDASEIALTELDFAAALAHAEAAISGDRFGERAQRLQLLALYALGRTPEALARYRSYRGLLDDELGLEPNAETRALETAVIRQEDIRSLLPRPIERAHAHADIHPVPFVGLGTELDALVEAVERGVDETLTLIQIEGATGVGKTRLLDALQARLDGVRIGRAACSLLERDLPYVPLAAALRQALPGVDADGGRLPALQQILPELAVDAPKRAGDELDALEALIAVLEAGSPVVLLLDDLHLADHRTLAALSYLRRRAAFPGAIVTTARLTRTQPGRPPHRFDADARLELEPLSHEALLAQCRAEGDWAYRVLIAAAVLEQPFDPLSLAARLGVDAAELVDELERLCERRILEIDGFNFRFHNDFLRPVLLESISPARRNLLRAQSAAA